MRSTLRLLAPLVLLLAMLLPAGGASAAPAQVERSVQFSGVFSNCNGEAVGVLGTIHLVIKEQKDGSFLSNGKVSGKAVASSGNEYVLNLISQGRGESVDDVSFEDRALLISRGSAPNELIIFRFDPDTGGTIEFECRG